MCEGKCEGSVPNMGDGLDTYKKVRLPGTDLLLLDLAVSLSLGWLVVLLYSTRSFEN